MWNIIFLVTGAMFIALLFIIFFTKDVVPSKENELFKALIITNCFEYVAEISLQLFVRNLGIDNTIVNIYSKLYLFTLFTWYSLFTLYTFVICLNRRDIDAYEKRFSKIKKINIIVWIFGIILLFILPFNKFYEGDKMYIFGMAVEIFKLFAVAYMLVWLILLIKNYKQLKNKRYLPIYAVLLLGIISNIIQTHDPSILIASMIGTFVCYIMYYTIENPDVKMINELNKNRVLVNQTMEDKSNFLFLASNQLKKPVDDIKNIANDAINSSDIEELQESLKAISNKSQDLSMFVHNVMDISSLSNSNIKMIPEKYNLKNLLAKIKIVEEKKLSNGVEFRFNVSDSIPEYLYGDSKLLEQILISVIENAIKYTKSGFIELRLNTIVKYDMARLIFTVEDSGLGISIDKVNELLMLDSELSKEELKRLETNNVNVNTIKKLISKLGGYFTIRSEVNKGTEIKFVIDQKIITDNVVNVNNITTKDKVLIATQDKDLMHSMIYILDNKGYNIETSIYSNDILDRIRLKEEYEYIFIDDNMDKRAIEVLKELKKNPKFKMKVIVILGKDLNLIKEHFIEDGFNNYIMKDDLEKEIERVLD